MGGGAFRRRNRGSGLRQLPGHRYCPADQRCPALQGHRRVQHGPGAHAGELRFAANGDDSRRRAGENSAARRDRKQYLCGKGDAVKRYDTIKKRPAKGALTQENIGFGLTVLAHSVLKKPGNPQRIARLFSRTVHPKPPGQNCAAPLKREFSMQSKENCRRHPLWLSRRFDEAMRGNSRFKDDVFLRQHA